MQLNWRQFEVDDEKKEIQDVVLEYEILSTTELEMRGIKPFKHGVVLEIIKLRSQWVYWEQPKWNTEKLVNLRTYLERLINPNQAFEKMTLEYILMPLNLRKKIKMQKKKLSL